MVFYSYSYSFTVLVLCLFARGSESILNGEIDLDLPAEERWVSMCKQHEDQFRALIKFAERFVHIQPLVEFQFLQGPTHTNAYANVHRAKL